MPIEQDIVYENPTGRQSQKIEGSNEKTAHFNDDINIDILDSQTES